MSKLFNLARRQGKTLAMEKVLIEYLKLNPDAVIVTYRNGNLIIEKPVKQVVKKKLEHK